MTALTASQGLIILKHGIDLGEIETELDYGLRTDLQTLQRNIADAHQYDRKSNVTVEKVQLILSKTYWALTEKDIVDKQTIGGLLQDLGITLLSEKECKDRERGAGR